MKTQGKHLRHLARFHLRDLRSSEQERLYARLEGAFAVSSLSHKVSEAVVDDASPHEDAHSSTLSILPPHQEPSSPHEKGVVHEIPTLRLVRSAPHHLERSNSEAEVSAPTATQPQSSAEDPSSSVLHLAASSERSAQASSFGEPDDVIEHAVREVGEPEVEPSPPPALSSKRPPTMELMLPKEAQGLFWWVGLTVVLALSLISFKMRPQVDEALKLSQLPSVQRPSQLPSSQPSRVVGHLPSRQPTSMRAHHFRSYRSSYQVGFPSSRPSSMSTSRPW